MGAFDTQDQWIKWLIQAVNVHFTRAAESIDLEARFEGQRNPIESEDERVEIKTFGPFFQEEGRDIRALLQARIDLFLEISEKNHNIYRYSEIAGVFMAAARKAIPVLEFGQCLQGIAVKNKYRGVVRASVPLEMGTIETDLSLVIEQ